MNTNTVRTALTVILFFSSFTFSFAYSNLKVLDPKSWWRYGRGKIEDATIVAEPKGLYTEVSYYLTLSSKATSMTSDSDTLEIVLNFDLPAGSIVTDSWLWVENDIIKADIIDRWTATNIYENIVKRRKDPSILVKNNDGYELRIFPLIGSKSRKVKITCMLLNKWSQDGSLQVNLPLEILKSSENQYCDYYSSCGSGRAPWANLLVKENALTTLYQGTNFSGTASLFSAIQDSTNRKFMATSIPSADFNNDFVLSFKPLKTKEGIFLSTFSTGPDKGYYQLMVLPNRALDIPVKRKTAFLIDYDVTKSSITKQQLFGALKSFILDNYTDKDSLAIFFSGFVIQGTGNQWVKGDSSSKARMFSTISDSLIKNYSNLTALLTKGSEFLHMNKGGDIVVISASEHSFAPGTSNELINEYVASLPKGTRFSAIDLVTNFSNGYYYNGSYLYGDAYFYSNISRFTKGYFGALSDYPSARNVNSYKEILSKTISVHSGTLSSFEIHTTLLNGFCSARQNLAVTSGDYSLNAPFLQVGKYNGKLPMIIQASGIYNGETFFRNFSVDENELSKGDSAIKTIWHGKYILDREVIQQSNPVVADIIDHSIQNRVLSKYTAFLALEPAQGGQICSTCPDESEAVLGLEEESLLKDSVSVIVFPTPATKQAKIVIKDYLGKTGDSELMIYNSLGEMIRQIDLQNYVSERGRLEVNLDVEEGNMPTGVYYLIYTNGERTKKGKMVIQR